MPGETPFRPLTAAEQAEYQRLLRDRLQPPPAPKPEVSPLRTVLPIGCLMVLACIAVARWMA
jgi:hypothetical protein